MGKFLVMAMMVVSMATFGACGGSSSGESGGDSASAPEITTIADLPAATGPMAESASAQLAKAAGVGKAARTGMNLATTAISFFEGDGKSLGACETLNVVKSAVSSAGMGDTILCYIAQMSQLPIFSQTDVDVYDGEWHIVKFGDQRQDQDSQGPGKVKFRIVKDAAGSINDFEMFMCSPASLQYPEGRQMEHIRQTINGTAFAMNSKGNFKEYHERGEWEGWHAVVVDGTLNRELKYTTKTINMWDKGSGTDPAGNSNTHNQYGVLTQTPGAFEFSGFRTGGFVDENSGSGQVNYSDQVSAAGEMLNDTSSNLLEVAVGDGGSLAVIAAAVGEVDHGQPQFNDYWDGDTGVGMSGAAAPAGNGYADVIAAIDLVDVAEFSIAFDASETWDCTDDVASVIEMTQQESISAKEVRDEVESACAQYNLGHDWMNCYSYVEYSPPSEGEGGGEVGLSCDSEWVCGAAIEQMQPACQACFADNEGDQAGTYDCLTALCAQSPDPAACGEGAEICNPANQ